MARSHYLAFDLGAESGRAVLGTLESARLTLVEKHRFANPTTRMLGHLHWNLAAQWEELKTGLKQLAGGPRLHGIGVDTWGVDFGLLDSDGAIMGNPFHYRDSRTDGVMEKAFSTVSRQRIFESTGIQFMQLNSLYQLLAMQRDNPSALKHAKTLLFVPDLFNYLFTGQRKSELSIASTSQMIDPGKQIWATDLLRELGLPTHFLPEIVPSGTRIGSLSDDVARECGVTSTTVIAPGCHDTASAIAAVPAQGDGWCYISSGTWSLMGVELNAPVLSEEALSHNYTNEAGVEGTIRFLRNIMGLWLIQECRRHWKKEGHEHNYAELTSLAAQCKGLEALVNPDHGAFLTPGDMPRKIDQYCEQTKQRHPVNPGQYVRACLDSLALTYRRTLRGMQEVLGRTIEVIHIVGGGVQNELLNQMTADACGKPVIAGPVEATAIGNVLVQAMAVGEIESLSEARAVVRASFDVKRYEPRDTKRWDQAAVRFEELVNGH